MMVETMVEARVRLSVDPETGEVYLAGIVLPAGIAAGIVGLSRAVWLYADDDRQSLVRGLHPPPGSEDHR
jgi:hypothetical protein